MAYHDSIIKHFENPSNVGSMDKNEKDVGIALEGAPVCGDVIKLSLKFQKKSDFDLENNNITQEARLNDNCNLLEDDSLVIVDAKFKTFGCGSAIASSSLLTEWVKGKTVSDVLKIKNSDIAEALSLPPVKWHCSVLAEAAVKSAINDYKQKKKNEAYNIKVSESAMTRIKQIFSENPGKTFLRFLAKNGGCSGKKYDVALDSKFDQNSGHLKINNPMNLNILIDVSSLDIFKNLEIDYVESSIESKFIFNNPNAENTCGCGESFG